MQTCFNKELTDELPPLGDGGLRGSSAGKEGRGPGCS